jgi:DnaJ-class molecular chaperone
MNETTFDRVYVGQTCPACKGSGKFATDVMVTVDGVQHPLEGNCMLCSGTGADNQQWISVAEFLDTMARMLRRQTGMHRSMEYKGGQAE